MKILFEVLERDRYEIYDPVIPAGAQARKIAREAGDLTVRILQFDPATLEIEDVTARFYDDYDGSYLEDVPLWIRERAGFQALAAEEERERREMQAHIRSFGRCAA